MPRLSSEIVSYLDKWCDSADIDYFSAFVKAYIPFNAWMNHFFPSLTKDRDKINGVKTSTNTFRDKIIKLLKLRDQQGENFRVLIGNLHDALEHSTISKSGESVSFANIVFGKNQQDTANVSRYGMRCHAHYDATTTHTILEVLNRSGNAIATLNFNSYPEEKDVITHNAYLRLSFDKRAMLLDVYRQVNPVLIGSLLVDDEDENIMCGTFKMTSDVEQLAAGLIEILYSLRNALFHGLIDPNKDANRVYEVAYQILHTLIKALA